MFTCSEKPQTVCNAVARLFWHDIPGADGEPEKVGAYQLSSEMPMPMPMIAIA